MEYKPHDYQQFAINYILEHPIAAVILGMGLGKTSITLTAIEQLIYDSFEVSKVLVVAPLRVARNTWSDEIHKWNHLKHLRYSIVLGSAAERKKALEADADIYIITAGTIDEDIMYCEKHKPLHTKDRAHASERGYGAKWQRERKKFLESNPFCVKCYEEGHITMATVVDHIIPHRGDQKLFWDRSNWQPLCEHHHNVKTMTEDRFKEYRF